MSLDSAHTVDGGGDDDQAGRFWTEATLVGWLAETGIRSMSVPAGCRNGGGPCPRWPSRGAVGVERNAVRVAVDISEHGAVAKGAIRVAVVPPARSQTLSENPQMASSAVTATGTVEVVSHGPQQHADTCEKGQRPTDDADHHQRPRK